MPSKSYKVTPRLLVSRLGRRSAFGAEDLVLLGDQSQHGNLDVADGEV